MPKVLCQTAAVSSYSSGALRSSRCPQFIEPPQPPVFHATVARPSATSYKTSAYTTSYAVLLIIAEQGSAACD